MATSVRKLLVVLMTVGFAIAGCSGGDERAAPEVIDLREPIEESADPEQEESVDSEPIEESVDFEQGDEPDVVAEVTTDSVASDEAVTIIDEPAQRLEQSPTIEASNWIARTFMDSTSVELIWSPVEGADNYRLFRLPTGTADFDAIATGLIEGADEIYTGPEFGYIDDDPPTGEFLTYLIVAEVGDEITEPRWTEALTVDDVTPPTPITGLSATDTADGVLLEWEPSVSYTHLTLPTTPYV